MAVTTRYVATETTPLYLEKTGGTRRATLLWGDRVVVTMNGKFLPYKKW